MDNPIFARAASGEKHVMWSGDPSRTAATIFAILFGIGAGYHVFQMLKFRAWYFSAFVIGAIMMAIGYIFRNISIGNPTSLMPYILQSLFIILPPSLYAATIYMIYGRIVLLVNAPHLSLIRPTRVTKVFVAGDAVSFLMQCSGGGMLASSEMADMGNKLMLLGLFVQLGFFGFFIIVSAVFNYRVNHSRAMVGGMTVPSYGKYHWKVMMKMLYGSAALIIFRCIFRVVEFSQGHDGAIMKNEAYIYCFDAVPMLIVQCMFHIVHAGMVFPKTFPDAKITVLDGESQYELSRGGAV